MAGGFDRAQEQRLQDRLRSWVTNGTHREKPGSPDNRAEIARLRSVDHGAVGTSEDCRRLIYSRPEGFRKVFLRFRRPSRADRSGPWNHLDSIKHVLRWWATAPPARSGETHFGHCQCFHAHGSAFQLHLIRFFPMMTPRFLLLRSSLRVGAFFGSLAASVAAFAVPIEGAPILVASTGDVIARFDGKSPGTSFSNDLYLTLVGPDLFLFNNFSSLMGTTINLGSFTAGTELVFRLHVINTNTDYFSGDPTRNPDGVAHAKVFDPTGGWTSVQWEDLFGNPEGAGGFNDLFFSFSNVVNNPGSVGAVPDEASTAGLLSAVLGGLCVLARRRRLTA